ncbi:hypothetical protein FEE96_21880 [Parasedimentitalea maritima]|uniref:DUF112 domain-containing protein n=1 Tax=Parasedimentitalea maritima TaxID=2578117 RepID=A0ABY2UUA1_9RHOB|nr:hypothetical protein FEE96_21880 [Zongyanglinia marina]
MAIYLAVLLLNILVVVFLLFSTNCLTRVMQITTRALGVTVLLLSFVGVYSLRNSITDCAIVATFGVFGVILKRVEFSNPYKSAIANLRHQAGSPCQTSLYAGRV